ncbi:MAG: RebB family R body protein [Sneathiella sp.]
MTDKTTSDTQKIRSVNSQITDAVTQSNAIVVGMAPANSMATLYQTMAQATGTALQNSVSNQQNVNTVGLAALTQNIQLILQPMAQRSVIHPITPIIIQQAAPLPEKKSKPKKDIE